MRRKPTPVTRAKAAPSPLKPAAALSSPAKTQGISSVRLAGISVPTKDTNYLLESDSVSERQLLCAIHVLDDCAKASTSHDGRELNSALAVQRALAFLVELTSNLDDDLRSEGGRKADHARTRSNKATVCAARVLGCLKRFIASSKYTHASFLQPNDVRSDRENHSCVHECHHTLVRLAVVFIIFNFSRARHTAAAVVAEGLEGFLLEMAHRGIHAKTTDRTSLADIESMESDDGSSEQYEAPPGLIPDELFQVHDLLLTVDPFDWCFQSLAADLARTATEGIDMATPRLKVHSPDSAFLVPLGARTLRYLLDGVTVPSDEVQEHAKRLDHTPLTCERCSRTVKSPHKLKPRRLPSIFAFPTVDDDKGSVLARVLCFSEREGTDPLTDSCRSVALSSEASIHFGLRSLIALAHHLPERSPERRALGGRCQRHLLKIRAKFALDDIGFSGCNEQISEPQRALPHQAVAISASTLAQLSATALVVVCGLGSQAKHSPSHDSKQTIQAATSLHCAKTPKSPVILSARLKAATVSAQREFAVWEADMLSSKAGRASCERERRHRNIRQAVTRLEQLRRSLAQGLELLRTGRSHPDPAQSFTDWIQSLPTVESVEREHQTEQEMRQRLMLEKQYQLEARRRREQDERALMTSNDCDVVYDAEVSAQADKHAHFLEMQAELRSLEDSLESPDSGVISSLPNSTSGILSPARKPAADFEKERAKQLAKQQRELEERVRLQQLRCQEHEARERSQMRREDVFFAERALRQQEQARRQSETAAEQLRTARERAMEAQRLKIAEMRQREFETKRAEQEVECMRVEELHSRQLRFFLAEQAKLERQREQTARKRMHTEEQDSRWRWQLVDRAAAQQEQVERRRQRAEERRVRRQKEHQTAEVGAGPATCVAGDWVQCWDDGGNAYYYNSRTGESQWDRPASC
jgi:hypothetical protein